MFPTTAVISRQSFRQNDPDQMSGSEKTNRERHVEKAVLARLFVMRAGVNPAIRNPTCGKSKSETHVYLTTSQGVSKRLCHPGRVGLEGAVGRGAWTRGRERPI
jgi:hypothetical protein